MSEQDLKDNSLETSSKFPWIGLSLISGFLAILSVIGEYEILIYSWSGHESNILALIYLVLPWIAIGLAILGISSSIAGITKKDSNKVFGIVGLLISLLPLFLCCLLFSFFCIASGGLMGL